MSEDNFVDANDWSKAHGETAAGPGSGAPADEVLRAHQLLREVGPWLGRNEEDLVNLVQKQWESDAAHARAARAAHGPAQAPRPRWLARLATQAGLLSIFLLLATTGILLAYSLHVLSRPEVVWGPVAWTEPVSRGAEPAPAVRGWAQDDVLRTLRDSVDRELAGFTRAVRHALAGPGWELHATVIPLDETRLRIELSAAPRRRDLTAHQWEALIERGELADSLHAMAQRVAADLAAERDHATR